MMNGTKWTGAAAIDRILVPGDHIPDEWTLADLHALGPTHAIEFPGGTPVRTVFLDRDGTIIVERDYLSTPDGVALLPGAAAGLRVLREAGVQLVVLSNQSGVGTGRITPGQLAEVDGRLGELLRNEGVLLSGTYYCVHRADAGCDCRKPLPGLALRAAAELGLDLRKAVMAGDKPADIGLARALGIPSFLVTTGYGAQTLSARVAITDYVVDGLDQLARICTHPAGLARAASAFD